MRSYAILVLVTLTAGAVFAAEGKTRVLVVTGGHGFQQEPFFKIFADNSEITFTKAPQGKSSEAYDREDLLSYDVIVLYDMTQKITDEQRKKFLSLFDKGVGLVALHHCLGSYQAWPEFEKIVGGKYLLKPETRNGKQLPTSGYQHGLDLTVNILQKDHPITRGLDTFVIHDEIYTHCPIAEGPTKLLKTTNPKSMDYLGWCHTYRKSRVVCLQGGHDKRAYENPNFRKLVANAIRWAARK